MVVNALGEVDTIMKILKLIHGRSLVNVHEYLFVHFEIWGINRTFTGTEHNFRQQCLRYIDKLPEQILLFLLSRACTTHLRVLASSFLRFRDHT